MDHTPRIDAFLSDLRRATDVARFKSAPPLMQGFILGVWGVALSLLPWPYAFYITLRVLICGLCLYFWSGMRAHSEPSWLAPALLVLAVVYNPIFVIHFGSWLAWLVLNVLTLWMLSVAGGIIAPETFGQD